MNVSILQDSLGLFFDSFSNFAHDSQTMCKKMQKWTGQPACNLKHIMVCVVRSPGMYIAYVPWVLTTIVPYHPAARRYRHGGTLGSIRVIKHVTEVWWPPEWTSQPGMVSFRQLHSEAIYERELKAISHFLMWGCDAILREEKFLCGGVCRRYE